VRRVSFDPDALPPPLKKRWTRWLTAARKARTEAEQAYDGTGTVATFQDRVWKRLLASFLLEAVFYNKCAYCEVNILVSGDAHAEHYRPKGAVTRLTAEDKEELVTVGGVPHPGYYWLAYEWRNLMPACQRCNTHGKRNFFPVGNVHVADRAAVTDLDELDRIEQPLLLNPFKDEPSQHLIFGRWGTVAALDGSERGAESIRIYTLDRGAVVDDRWVHQQRAMDDWLKIMGDHDASTDEIRARLQAKLDGLRTGRAPYSVACLDFLRSRDKQVDEILTLT
jgi:hypothetical protein